jgi:hypothetical protein
MDLEEKVAWCLYMKTVLYLCVMKPANSMYHSYKSGGCIEQRLADEAVQLF